MQRSEERKIMDRFVRWMESLRQVDVPQECGELLWSIYRRHFEGRIERMGELKNGGEFICKLSEKKSTRFTESQLQSRSWMF